MEKSLKEKFENINLEDIPDHLRFELETIREETSDFSDEDAVDIFKKNFNYLYFVIGKKHPTAMKDYVPPPPTEEELEAKRKEDEYNRLMLSGGKKVLDNDFEGALADYNNALSLDVDNEAVSSAIAETEKLKEKAEEAQRKEEQLAKAKAIADKYKKPKTEGAQA